MWERTAAAAAAQRQRGSALAMGGGGDGDGVAAIDDGAAATGGRCGGSVGGDGFRGRAPSRGRVGRGPCQSFLIFSKIALTEFLNARVS